MTPHELDWIEFRKAVAACCDGSLRWLEGRVHESPIYSFGVEGLIEQGAVSISANSSKNRSSEAPWWIPDWKIRYIDERIGLPGSVEVFSRMADSIGSVLGGDYSDGDWQDICRLFRLHCLLGMRDALDARACSFPVANDFSPLYMDEVGAFYLGRSALDEAILKLNENGA